MHTNFKTVLWYFTTTGNSPSLKRHERTFIPDSHFWGNLHSTLSLTWSWFSPISLHFSEGLYQSFCAQARDMEVLLVTRPFLISHVQSFTIPAHFLSQVSLESVCFLPFHPSHCDFLDLNNSFVPLTFNPFSTEQAGKSLSNAISVPSDSHFRPFWGH